MPWSLCTHTPYVLAGSSQRCARLETRGAPGQRLALSFDIVTDELPLDAVVSVARLRSAGGSIDPEAIDVRVVAVRRHAGIGVHRAAPIDAPELLLKDDRVEPNGHYSRWCGHLRHVHRARHGARHYRAPDLRLAGDAVTAVAPHSRRQIWITVSLRHDLAPGVYAGAIEVRDLRDGPGTSIPLRVEVLPIALHEPAQRRMLWFRGTLDCARPQFYVGEECFLHQLIDIRAHGFDTISLAERSTRLLRRALALAHAAGFRAVVLEPPLPPDLVRRDLDGFAVTCYVSDEIDQRGPAAFASHRASSRAAERLGLPTMASLVRERFVAQLATLDLDRPDVASFYLPSNVDYFRTAAAFPGLRSQRDWYYWMASMEKPNVHRVLAGLYLWKSGAAGISPYCYQHLPRAPYDPYDDFDEWEPGSTAGTSAAPLKDQLATYPARAGSVPTLQWEGLGEGITDLRYLATVESLLGAARASSHPDLSRLCREVEARLRDLADRVPLAPIRIAGDAEAEPYPHLDARDYARFRDTLAEDAIALSRALAAGSPARVGAVVAG